jgi:hypothetical protein
LPAGVYLAHADLDGVRAVRKILRIW